MTDFKELIVNIDASLVSVLKQMDKTSRKLLIVYKDELYKTLISIGDIQRAIISGIALETPIKDILRKDVKVANIHQSPESIKKLLGQFRMEFIPVLDDKETINKVIYWEDVFKNEERTINAKLTCPIVIMAGGKGSRLKPITNIIPKPLIPIGERPIMQWIIDSFVKHGVNQFYVSVNYKKEMIQRFFDEIVGRTYSLEYFTEKKPLGTAGSLQLLKGNIKEAFFVSNCDILIQDDYNEMMRFHHENKNDLTAIAVIRNYSIPYGTMKVSSGGLLLEFREKPEHVFLINAGLYILEPKTLDEIPENQIFHITDLMLKIKDNGGRVGIYPVSDGSWYDIGEWNQYSKTIRRLKGQNINGIQGFL